jgi:hypothetical protein
VVDELTNTRCLSSTYFTKASERIRKNVNFGEVKGKCPSTNIAAGLVAAQRRSGREWGLGVIPSSVRPVEAGSWKRFFRFPTL